MAQSMWGNYGPGGVKKKSTDTSIDSSIALLKKYGLYQEPKPKKLPVLSRIGLLLNSFSPTTAYYKSAYEGKEFLPEYGKNILGSIKAGATGTEDKEFLAGQKSGKDILVKEGMSDRKGKLDMSDVLGLGVDIATDPTTYLTAGLAKGGTKIFGQGGKAFNLSKKGTQAMEAFEQAGKYATREAAEKAFAKTLTETPELLAKRGIRLAGQTIVPGSALDKIGFGAVADKGLVTGTAQSLLGLSTKIPVVGKPIEKVSTAAASLFDPLTTLKKAMPEQADYITNLMTRARRGTKGEQSIVADRLVKLADQAYKLDPEAGAKITRVIEEGLGVAPETAASINAKVAAQKAGVIKEAVTPKAKIAVSETGEDVTKVMESFNKKVKEDLSSKAYYAKSHADDLNRKWTNIRSKKARAEKAGNKELAYKLQSEEDDIFPLMRDAQNKVSEMKKSGADIASASYDKNKARISVKITDYGKTIDKTVGDGRIQKMTNLLRSDDIYNGTYTKDTVGYLRHKGIIDSKDEKILLDNLNSAEKIAKQAPAEEIITKTPKAKKELTRIQQVGRDLGKKKAEITALGKKRDKVLANITDPGQKTKLAKAYDTKAEKLLKEKTALDLDYAALKQGEVPLGAYKKSDLGDMARGELNVKATTGNPELDKIAIEIKDILSGRYEAELEGGLKTGKIENYVHRMTTPEAEEMFSQRGIDLPSKIKEYSTKFKAQKSRVQQEQFISDINAKFKKDFGVDYNMFEEDIFKSTIKREFDGIRAGNNQALKTTLENELGVSAKDLDKLGKYQGIQYVEHEPGKFIPKEVADALSKVKNIADDKSLNTFLQMYDKGLKVWKGSVTRYFPSFHARNFMGASFNNWLAGVDNPMRYVQAAKIVGSKDTGYIVTKGGTQISFDTIREALQKNNILGQTGMWDVNKDLADITGSIGKTSAVGKVTKPLKKASDVAFEGVENEVRSTLFIDRLIKGDSVQEATNQVFKYHFDYSPEAYTHFENSVLKRIAPFYTWTRNNIPLQLEQLGKQPGKYASIMKVKNMFDQGFNDGTREDLVEEQSLMPEYMKEQFTLRLGKGKTIQIPLPMEDLTRMKPKEAYGLLAPFIKMPFEIIANKNIYMDMDIENKDLPKELRTVKTIIDPKYVNKPMEKFLNLQETTITDPNTGEEKKQYEMDAMKMYIIRSLAGRLYSTAEDWKSQEKTDTQKITKTLLGLAPKQVDIDKQEYYQALDQNAGLSEVVKYFRTKSKMPTAEEEKESKKTVTITKYKKGKKVTYKKLKTPKLTKASSKKSKQQKAKLLIKSAKANR